jgi:hypothetical protein
MAAKTKLEPHIARKHILRQQAPAHLRVMGTLWLDETEVHTLPPHLTVDGDLRLEGCLNLAALPPHLRVSGSINAEVCSNLSLIDKGLHVGRDLNLQHCARLNYIPDGTHIGQALNIGSTGIRRLPTSLQHAELRWLHEYVKVAHFINPNTITVDDLMWYLNAELRRMMLEMMGIERFIEQTQHYIINQDTEASGYVRQLLRIPKRVLADEDMYVLFVTCPSTAHRYVLRVPPYMRTCVQAAAWLAGFDDPSAWQPIRET